MSMCLIAGWGDVGWRGGKGKGMGGFGEVRIVVFMYDAGENSATRPRMRKMGDFERPGHCS